LRGFACSAFRCRDRAQLRLNHPGSGCERRRWRRTWFYFVLWRSIERLAA
jgi:hypothetical protein